MMKMKEGRMGEGRGKHRMKEKDGKIKMWIDEMMDEEGKWKGDKDR